MTTPNPHQHSDARFAEVVVLPSAKELRRRLPLLLVGLGFLGFSIAASVRAELGLSPVGRVPSGRVEGHAPLASAP